MSFDNPESLDINGSDKSFALVASRFNEELVDGLLERTVKALEAADVSRENISILRVPGANEIPFVVNMQAERDRFDCIICLGVVIAGATSHHEHIAHSTSNALQMIGIEQQVPVINGIITTNSLEEARERTIGKIDRGAEFAHAALEMAGHKILFEEEFEELMTEIDDDLDDEQDDIFDRN